MQKNKTYECENVYRNQDIEIRKNELAKIIADIINHQLGTKK